jgi:hypothetical protein
VNGSFRFNPNVGYATKPVGVDGMSLRYLGEAC